MVASDDFDPSLFSDRKGPIEKIRETGEEIVEKAKKKAKKNAETEKTDEDSGDRDVRKKGKDLDVVVGPMKDDRGPVERTVDKAVGERIDKLDEKTQEKDGGREQKSSDDIGVSDDRDVRRTGKDLDVVVGPMKDDRGPVERTVEGAIADARDRPSPEERLERKAEEGNLQAQQILEQFEKLEETAEGGRTKAEKKALGKRTTKASIDTGALFGFDESIGIDFDEDDDDNSVVEYDTFLSGGLKQIEIAADIERSRDTQDEVQKQKSEVDERIENLDNRVENLQGAFSEYRQQLQEGEIDYVKIETDEGGTKKIKDVNELDEFKQERITRIQSTIDELVESKEDLEDTEKELQDFEESSMKVLAESEARQSKILQEDPLGGKTAETLAEESPAVTTGLVLTSPEAWKVAFSFAGNLDPREETDVNLREDIIDPLVARRASGEVGPGEAAFKSLGSPPGVIGAATFAQGAISSGLGAASVKYPAAASVGQKAAKGLGGVIVGSEVIKSGKDIYEGDTVEGVARAARLGTAVTAAVGTSKRFSARPVSQPKAGTSESVLVKRNGVATGRGKAFVQQQMEQPLPFGKNLKFTQSADVSFPAIQSTGSSTYAAGNVQFYRAGSKIGSKPVAATIRSLTPRRVGDETFQVSKSLVDTGSGTKTGFTFTRQVANIAKGSKTESLYQSFGGDGSGASVLRDRVITYDGSPISFTFKGSGTTSGTGLSVTKTGSTSLKSGLVSVQSKTVQTPVEGSIDYSLAQTAKSVFGDVPSTSNAVVPVSSGGDGQASEVVSDEDGQVSESVESVETDGFSGVRQGYDGGDVVVVGQGTDAEQVDDVGGELDSDISVGVVREVQRFEQEQGIVGGRDVVEQGTGQSTKSVLEKGTGRRTRTGRGTVTQVGTFSETGLDTLPVTGLISLQVPEEKVAQATDFGGVSPPAAQTSLGGSTPGPGGLGLPSFDVEGEGGLDLDPLDVGGVDVNLGRGRPGLGVITASEAEFRPGVEQATLPESPTATGSVFGVLPAELEDEDENVGFTGLGNIEVF